MPLSFARINETVMIQKIMTSNVRQHLADLGLIEGESIAVIQKGHAGVIVSVKGVRLALSKELADHIYVREE